jgi:hypothetical protein
MYSNFRLFRLSMAMVLIVLGLTSVASAQITFINPVNADSTTNDHISGSRHIAAVPDGSGGYVAVGFYRDNDAIAELKFVYDLENATGGQSVQSISEGSDLVILGNLYRDENDKVHAVYMAAGTLKYRNNIALATQLQSPGGIGSGTVTDGLNASFAFPSVAFHATGDGNTDKSGVGGIIYRGTGGIEVQKFSLDASGFFSHDGSPIDVTTDNTGLRPHVGTSSSGDLVITYMRNGNLYMADDVQAAGFNNEALIQAATGQVSVDVNTADGTAVAGTDYTAVDGTITIPAGQTERKLIPLLLTFVPQPPSEPDCALLKPFPGQGDRPSQQ